MDEVPADADPVPAGPLPVLRDDPEHHVYVCDRCGDVMDEIHCKIICPSCGYTRDCSDP